MLIESFSTNLLFGKNRESYTAPETWDVESTSIFVFYILWLIFWIITIVSAIKLTTSKKYKNGSAAIVLSVLSWPFYWLFKIFGSFN